MTKHLAYENHYVVHTDGYQYDQFICAFEGADSWIHADWEAFNFCPFCSQELENQKYDPPESEPFGGP